MPDSTMKQCSRCGHTCPDHAPDCRHIPRRTPADRFWARVIKTDGCWLWRGTHTRGYGIFSVNQTPIGAHRFSYELAHGSIPEGMFICHTCDNPGCVNPAHLWAGTHQENVTDMITKGRNYTGGNPPDRVARGERTHHAKLTASQVIEIRSRHKSNPTSHAQLAKEYDVNPSMITRIINRENWKHIP
jgi:hypothetical protein